MGVVQNLEVDTFPDPVCHFWRFWILQAVQQYMEGGVADSEQSAPGASMLVFLSNSIGAKVKNQEDL